MEAGAARVLDSKSLTGASLAAELRELFADPARLAAMSTAAGSLARRDTAERIIADCRALVAGEE
jgi:UDP-N-acetylglucosamine:LPS N-acetylglucosamine transferase